MHDLSARGRGDSTDDEASTSDDENRGGNDPVFDDDSVGQRRDHRQQGS